MSQQALQSSSGCAHLGVLQEGLVPKNRGVAGPGTVGFDPANVFAPLVPPPPQTLAWRSTRMNKKKGGGGGLDQ